MSLLRSISCAAAADLVVLPFFAELAFDPDEAFFELFADAAKCTHFLSLKLKIIPLSLDNIKICPYGDSYKKNPEYLRYNPLHKNKYLRRYCAAAIKLNSRQIAFMRVKG